MTKSFSEVSTAAEFRDVIERIVDGRINTLRPDARVAEVTEVNTEQLVAHVKFSGDTGSFKARFGKSLIPRTEGAIVRVVGRPGNYYITEILNGSGAHETYEPLPGLINDLEVEVGVVSDSVAVIQLDVANVYTAIDEGDTANQVAINNAISDFNAGLATKSKHTLSPNAPTTSSAGNAGDVWERHLATDITKIIGRWRLMNSVSPYNWSPMNLDATYIPQLDIGTGTFGDLSGTRLLANTIGVGKLIISDFTNHIVNPGAEDNTLLPHVAISGTWIVDTAAPRSGTYAFRCTLNTMTTVAYVLFANGARTATAQKLPVDVGDTVRVEAWVRRGATVAGTPGAHIYVDQVHANGTTTNGGQLVPAGNVRSVTLSTTYQLIASEFVITDPTITHVGLGIAVATATAGDLMYVDDMRIGKKYGGEVILDGTMYARHLSTDILTALIVRGDVLETDAGFGRGIKISTNGILGYDNDTGQARLVINPTTGVFELIDGLISGGSITGATVTASIVSSNSGSGYVVSMETANYWLIGSPFPTLNFKTGGTSRATIQYVDYDSGILSLRHWNGGEHAIGGTRGHTFTGTTLFNQSVTFNGGLTMANPINMNGYSVQNANNFIGQGAQIGSSGITVSGGGITLSGGLTINSGGMLVGGTVELNSLEGTGQRNVVAGAGGVLSAPASSMRYKENDQTLRENVAERLYNLNSIVWQYKDRKFYGNRLYAGFSAEQAHEEGLSLFVDYDKEGRPDNVRTQDLAAPLLVLIRQQRNQIDELLEWKRSITNA